MEMQTCIHGIGWHKACPSCQRVADQSPADIRAEARSELLAELRAKVEGLEPWSRPEGGMPSEYNTFAIGYAAACAVILKKFLVQP